MPSAAAIVAAHARDAKARHDSYSKPVRIGATEKKGAYNAARFVKNLGEGGWLAEHDATVRLLKSDWAFAKSDDLKKVTVELWLNGDWVGFKVESVQDVHLAGEWRVGLGARIG